MILVKLGLKNLQRNFRRSLITVMSIGWGLAVILWLQAILNGSNKSIVDTISSTYHGHLQIFRTDYLDQKLIQQFFTFDEKWLPKFEDTEIFASERIHLPALVSSGEQSTPIILEGVDPEKEARITRIKESLVAGEYITNEPGTECELKEAYISKTLAKLLNVELGHKIVILAQASDGSLGNDLFRVKGLFSTGSPDYDKSVVITTKPCVMATGVLGGVHEVVLRIKGDASPEDVQAALQANLPAGLKASSWKEISPRLAAMIVYNDASLVLVSIMLFIVISLGILNTFLVTVFERTKEFGVMMALGTPARGIIGTVLCEAFFLGVTASVLGIVLATLFITYHATVGYDLRPLVGQNFTIGTFRMDLMIYPVINWIGAIKATLFTILIVVIATFYPAFKASRLQPADAIRSQ